MVVYALSLALSVRSVESLIGYYLLPDITFFPVCCVKNKKFMLVDLFWLLGPTQKVFWVRMMFL